MPPKPQKAVLSLQKTGQRSKGRCSSCGWEWFIRKRGGAKKCPRCQAEFGSKKKVA